jgi:hypothetical protein
MFWAIKMNDPVLKMNNAVLKMNAPVLKMNDPVLKINDPVLVIFFLVIPTPYYQSSWRMARGGHELSKVSLGPAMPDLCTPCGRAIPETAAR